MFQSGHMQISRLCDRGYSPLQIDYEGLQKKFPILKYGSGGQGGGGYEVGLNMDIYLQVSHLCDKSLQVVDLCHMTKITT